MGFIWCGMWAWLYCRPSNATDYLPGCKRVADFGASAAANQRAAAEPTAVSQSAAGDALAVSQSAAANANTDADADADAGRFSNA